ncbi:hypothetical protein ABTL50_19950, partial [Acinetobacter baumannii]
MTMTSASVALPAAAQLPLVSDSDSAPLIFAAAQLLLPHLERGQRIDAATLRGKMEAAFGASDSAGAWDW